MSKQNVRLTTINLALMAMLIASLVAVGWTRVGAQSEEGDENAPAEVHECDFIEFEGGYGMEEVAKAIGIDEETLWTELEAGKTLAQIAQDNGVDPQKVIDVMVAEELKFIDELVEAGDITAEEAAEWKAETAKYIEFEVNTVFVDPYEVAAKTIGIDTDTLWSELDTNKSVAEIAQANGVEPQAVIDAVIASENEMIDKEIAAGLLTEEDAKEWRAEIAEYVADMINKSFAELEAEFMEDFDFEDEGFGDEDGTDSETDNG